MSISQRPRLLFMISNKMLPQAILCPELLIFFMVDTLMLAYSPSSPAMISVGCYDEMQTYAGVSHLLTWKSFHKCHRNGGRQ